MRAGRRADRAQGRRGPRGRGHLLGHRRRSTSPRGRQRDGPAPARGRRGRPRQDEPARAGDLRLHRDRGLGHHPQPLGPRPHAGRLQRRLRRGAGRRALRRRVGVGRRRVDPHPRRALRPVRAEAAARPDLARPGSRALARAVGDRLAGALGRGLGPLARRLPRRRQRRPARARADVLAGRAHEARARCGSPSRPRRHARSPPPIVGDRGQGGRRARPPTCCARSATRSRRATPTGAWSATTSPRAT